MPATIFPAPGAASGSVQWSTNSTTFTGSSSGTTVTLASGTTDPGWIGTTPVINSGTGQFATNTLITSVATTRTYAAAFSGSGQYLTVPSTGTNAAFTFAGNFTVENSNGLLTTDGGIPILDWAIKLYIFLIFIHY